MPGDDLYWNSIDFGSEESLAEPHPSGPYIDPWDLENYAYIRDHIDAATTGAHQDSTASSYYVPPDGPKRLERHYAAIDEVASRSHRGAASFDSETDESPYEDNVKDSSSLYVYQTKDRWRDVVLPGSSSSTRDRSFSFSYGDHSNDYYGNRQDIYSKLDDVKKDYTLPIYDDVKFHRKPTNFSLSNYGHLKIDYSYSWNSLHKYIHK